MSSSLWRKYKNSDVVVRFILINVALFILLLFVGVFSVLFNVPDVAKDVLALFEVPASFNKFLIHPWVPFTYMFVHAGPFHLLWNMLALYVFGKIFLNFYSVRHFIGIYFWGGLMGALFFAVAYNVFPYFALMVSRATLVGASAAVLAIVVAAAVRAPGYRINLFLVGSVKLSTFALVTVLISFLLIASDNAGGSFAHLGGAFAGWLFAHLLGKGVDAASLLLKPYDWLCALFALLKKCGKKKRKGNFRYTKNERTADYEDNARKKNDEAEIDRLLEKIKKGGYASLSDEEKKRLFEASSR